MTRHRGSLPQSSGRPFLTDGGIETTLLFQEGFELPCFAAFSLLQTAEGRDALRRYFTQYAELARRFGTGLVLESPTWRASSDWGDRLGYDAAALAAANRDSIALLEEIRGRYDSPSTPAVVSGCIGPRGDAYASDAGAIAARDAESYHQRQIDTLAATTADMVCALTLNHPDEAIGIARAARRAGMPVAISFTVETDGRLPTGPALGASIEQIDGETAGYPCYYMINCAHPTHFRSAIEAGGAWLDRLVGVRANASRMSHAELDRATVLDAGDPAELAQHYRELKARLPRLSVLGGCCGTDTRHLERIAAACLPLFATAA